LNYTGISKTTEEHEHAAKRGCGAQMGTVVDN